LKKNYFYNDDQYVINTGNWEKRSYGWTAYIDDSLDFFDSNNKRYNYNCYNIGIEWVRLVSSVINQKSFSLSISPNPATDYINIKPSEGFEPSEGYKIQIFDILGIEMSFAGGGVNKVDGGGSIRIDISNLPAGVYFIRIGDKVEKFLKM
jgi:hypothetical protein